MNVLVVYSVDPFRRPPRRAVADELGRNLLAEGHRSEVIGLPFACRPPQQLPSQMLLARSYEILNVDRLVALDFPAYLVRHPAKTVWMLDQEVGVGDPGTRDGGGIQPTTSEAVEHLVAAGKSEALSESRSVFVGGTSARKRVETLIGLKPEILIPPIGDAELFSGGSVGEYIFSGGPVNSHARHELLIEALSVTPSSGRLVIAGLPDSKADATRLQALVERLGVSDRVTLEFRELSRREHAEFVNNATAVAVLTVDGDQLTRAAVEAALAGKALITTTDCELVGGLPFGEATGWVSAPVASALAESVAGSVVSPRSAVERGEELRRRFAAARVTWPLVIEELLR